MEENWKRTSTSLFVVFITLVICSLAWLRYPDCNLSHCLQKLEPTALMNFKYNKANSSSTDNFASTSSITDAMPLFDSFFATSTDVATSSEASSTDSVIMISTSTATGAIEVLATSTQTTSEVASTTSISAVTTDMPIASSTISTGTSTK